MPETARPTCGSPQTASLVRAALWLMLFGLAVPVRMTAATIWTGPALSFTNRSVADVDQLTTNVWLTRDSLQGLYNVKQESSFNHFSSPTNTAWADGTTANYATLTYTDWNTWAKIVHGGPPSTVGVNAVVHLISDDIYLDIKFTSWPTGGGFAYDRSTPPAAANNPPSVTITNPASGTVFAAPANVTLQASASDSDGAITNVQFLVGATVLTNQATAPFSVVASNLASGSYAFFAVASDNLGSKATNTATVTVVTPVPVSFSLPARTTPAEFQFSYAANAGLRYVVQRSTNLTSPVWSTLATNLAGSSSVNFTDSSATVDPGFYRVGRLPNP